MRHAARYIAIALILMASCTGFTLAQESADRPEPSPQAAADQENQTKSGQRLSVIPSQITIAGVAGKDESRTLVFRAEKQVSELQIIPMDLYREDGNAVFPADALRVALSENKIETDGFLSVPLTLNLKDVPSGEFKGQLIFKYKEGEISVPLTVKVKDPFGLPLAIIIIGVGVGMGVSAYRSGGKPRDEAIVRIDDIQKQLENEKVLKDSPFHAEISAHLAVAISGLQNQKWSDVKESLNQVDAILLRWDRYKADWIRQFKYSKELKEKLKAMIDGAEYKLKLERDIEETLRNAPEQEDPEQLRSKLDDLRKRINIFLSLEDKYDLLEKMWDNVENDHEREKWRVKLQALKDKLKNLIGETQDQSAHDAAGKEIENTIAEIKKLPSKSEEQSGEGRAVSKAEELAASGSRLIQTAPSSRPYQKPKWFEFSTAQKRLKAFTWLTYALAVGFLAFAGFSELYLANPVFGSSSWGDYSALMAWGFGAEASRASITDMVKGWGVSLN